MNELDFLNEIKELEKLTKNNGFTCRKLKESDWETLVGWWKWWRWAIMPKDFLPENGTGGLIVEKNKTPIVAGFLYKTNSNVVILEWIVSNPEYKNKNRKKAIELLITEAEDISKKEGYKYMFSIGRSKHLLDIHEKLDWHVDSRSSHEITKKLK
tara:strand:+ start:14747 stop:15211 length:465 start_codon:yes stop_codon:yes gene_type:complete